MSTDALTWLGEVEKRQRPVSRGGAVDGDVRYVARNALASVVPSMLAVVEAAQHLSWTQHVAEEGIFATDEEADGAFRENYTAWAALRGALDAFTAAVREEQERHG